MNLNQNRRMGDRKQMDLPVSRQEGHCEMHSWTADLSPTGVKLKVIPGFDSLQALCNLELHLVPGAITTVLAAKRVWQNDAYEAFEFLCPSFAQQMILEKMVGNL